MSRRPPTPPAIHQPRLNVIQKLVHHALERNVLQRRDTDQLHLAADVGKSHTRNPALAAVSGMNVWWAVIVGEYIDHGPSGFGYEHPTHGRT
jgi:hypothetical protein